jgi:hypothetical protein
VIPRYSARSKLEPLAEYSISNSDPDAPVIPVHLSVHAISLPVEVATTSIIPEEVFVRVKSFGQSKVSVNPPQSLLSDTAYLIARSALDARFLSSFADLREVSRLVKRVSDLEKRR